MPRVVVHRFGAIGDAIIMTPVLRLLKKDGYHVTVNCNNTTREVLKHNPNVDVFRKHDTGKKLGKELDEYLENINKDYDRAVNLCESVEGSLSKVHWRKDFYWSKEKRHKECNINFYDNNLKMAGYDARGLRGELYFSKLEEKLAKEYRRKYRGKFFILWSLAGSSVCKAYPYTELIIKALTERYRDIIIATIGDSFCELIEPRGRGIKNYSGKWPIRKSLIMTKYADLVVGTDTGIMHGAGCFDTPKILLLSATTKENLSLYWNNCVELSANSECQPCHRIVHTTKYCILDEKLKTPICMTQLKPADVVNAIMKVYNEWRHKQYGSTNSANAYKHNDGSVKESGICRPCN